MNLRIAILFFIFQGVFFITNCHAQQNKLWHGIEREIHYKPDGEDFVLVNGKRRFNRALYGSNSAFRAEAGDLPEFALYLPGMGGNLKFGLIKGAKSKWLIDADQIETRYRPGSMIYFVKDSLLGTGTVTITALAVFESEALIVRIEGENIPGDVELFTAYGGATGTKFSRDGDIGADPESSFYLKPDYCKGNAFRISNNAFTLYYGSKSLSEEERYEIQYKPKTDTARSLSSLKKINGVFPPNTILKIGNAYRQGDPLQFFSSGDSLLPALVSRVTFATNPLYFFLQNGETPIQYNEVPSVFNRSEVARKTIAGRIKINTPDAFINTLGGALSIAADAVWESPSYLHGAVAWRMRLPGWRGAYLADVLGWHDRAKTHFNAYALSQLTEPLAGPVVMDTALHLARHAETMGTSVFSSGYISRNPGGDKRPHHYDMNLVFIDQLLNHFLWTGDKAYVKTMWPLLKRHLAWEDRNFDVDGDNLYDAYAAIWASDALQYSGGAVTHSSAYNYKAYRMAAELAQMVSEDPRPYRKKADLIFNAINTKLWMKDKGVYAEYKDLLGKQLLHPSPGLWTIYHAIDSKIPDAFQAYQSLRWIDDKIPHIPIRAKGLNDSTLYTISTTNWQPYTWSLNNVVLGEVMHTALANWQGGRSEVAFDLFKGALVESMYLGASPGNFQQLSFYDAMRGELYRDFADDIGTTARSLVEGLFGVFCDALHDTLHISPGFPMKWNYASLSTPDLDYHYDKGEYADTFKFSVKGDRMLNLSMNVRTYREAEFVVVNGKKVKWTYAATSIELPRITIQASAAKTFMVVVKWRKKRFGVVDKDNSIHDDKMRFKPTNGSFVKLYDPMNALKNVVLKSSYFSAGVKANNKQVIFFLQLKQGTAYYWTPVSTVLAVGRIVNRINYEGPQQSQFEKVNLTPYFNDELSNIFKNQYLSPRPKVPTLQLPTQGIGNWAYPLVQPNISDSGLRQRAGEKNEFTTSEGIPFSTPSRYGAKNILFTSQWDNYPDSIIVPLSSKASHAYLLMAGSTNPMQSRLVNGEVVIQYRDGSEEKLELRNPENWWPIEQDYYEDGYAFTTGAPKPVRLYFKTGKDTKEFKNYTSIRGFSNRGIDGGAGTVLEMPLNPAKELRSLTLKAVCNDVVIGLMSLTLVRPN